MASKTFAVVGPSAHLDGLGHGAKIDKYEVIIRVNEFGPTTNYASYGSRTDIVFHNFRPGSLHSLEKEAREYSKRMSNPVKIICPRNVNQIGEEFLPVEKIERLLPKGFSVERLEFESKEHQLEFPKNPTTGFFAIMWALKVAEKPFICGFNFYSSRNTYHSEKQSNRLKNGLPRINVSGHKTKEEVDFLSRFLVPGMVDCDSEFHRLVILGEYRGKNLPLYVLQVLRNSMRGLIIRATSLFKKHGK